MQKETFEKVKPSSRFRLLFISVFCILSVLQWLFNDKFWLNSLIPREMPFSCLLTSHEIDKIRFYNIFSTKSAFQPRVDIIFDIALVLIYHRSIKTQLIIDLLENRSHAIFAQRSVIRRHFSPFSSINLLELNNFVSTIHDNLFDFRWKRNKSSI